MMGINFVKCNQLESLIAYEEAGNIKDGMFVWCDETERLYIHMKGKLIGITPKNKELVIKEVKCKHCGAPMKISNDSSIAVCKYCRTPYDIDIEFDLDVF